MHRLSWLLTFAFATWLLLWRRLGDRWGWLGMLNAWAEWGVASLAALSLTGALRRQWHQSAVSLTLWLLGANQLPAVGLLPFSALRRVTGHEPTVREIHPETGAEDIRLFSCNLYKHSRSAAEHLALIHAEQPDILCFQELTPPLARELLAGLEASYPYRVWRPREDADGLGVLSRFPLEESGYWEKPGALPWALRVRCRLPNGEEMEIYNVHLVPPTAPSTLRMGMTRGFRIREEQLRLMQQEIEARGLPACVIGDCNFSDSSDAYRIACARLEDAWPAAGEGTRWTWPTRHFPFQGVPWTPRLLRLDYCFHNARVRPKRMRVLTSPTGSDHCPLLVHLAVDRCCA